MKSASDLLDWLRRQYKKLWAHELVTPDDNAWPLSVSVGRPSRKELEANYARLSAEANALELWAAAHGLACVHEPRLVGRISYQFLTHVQAPDIDTLARAVGCEGHLACYRKRLQRLRKEFPLVKEEDLSRVLSQLSRGEATEVDFDLLCRAASWFTCNDASHMTPREVPLEGFHAKWLDVQGHRRMIELLVGVDELQFQERPRLVRFCYLDSSYLQSGRRQYDSWLVGDAVSLAYQPEVALICENRDSALFFERVPKGVAILGDGSMGPSVLPEVPWLSRVSQLFYWGDIDRQGFEILAQYRQKGLVVHSMLMDLATYQCFERFGTNVDKRGNPLVAKPDAMPLVGLTAEENALYLQLCSQKPGGPRRIEQERIPLGYARDVLMTKLN